MLCPVCHREKPLVARGLCNACYQRLRSTGSTEYRRWGKRSVCGVRGCDKQVVSNGLCDTHRKRMDRHGHLEETRPDDWGAKRKHPLFNTWAAMRRRRRVSVDARWANFLRFVIDVGERPSAKHRLVVVDAEKPIGPDNFAWKSVLAVKEKGEHELAYQAKAQRMYRQLRRDAYKGYHLKKSFDLSFDDFCAMSDAQGHKCAICGVEEDRTLRGSKVSLSVDHCHASGKVRALLCSKCNVGLGSFRDDPAALRAAALYLERHAKVA